ncbi:MAG: hypothetical protein IT242_10725 [Bacteroidia bacterium]|nr:hypothetical protein [Bacteroidia bacterium]
MKQRAKLSLALLADTPLVFLDEPCSNLDRNAIEWYQDLIAQYTTQKLVVVCSNSMPDEYSFCTSRVMITDWKPGIS